MRVAGIAVDLPGPNRPACRLVVVSDSGGSPAIETVEDFTAADTDLPEILHHASEAVNSRLQGLGVDRVVVRRADRAPKPNNNEGPKSRLLMEGALTSAARRVVVETRLGTGRDVGTWHGSSKGDVEAAALALLEQGGHHKRYVESTSAALAGLR